MPDCDHLNQQSRQVNIYRPRLAIVLNTNLALGRSGDRVQLFSVFSSLSSLLSFQLELGNIP